MRLSILVARISFVADGADLTLYDMVRLLSSLYKSQLACNGSVSHNSDCKGLRSGGVDLY
jgi:hypothetical protein